MDFIEELLIFWGFLFPYFDNTSITSAYNLGLDVLLSRLSQLSLDESKDEGVVRIVEKQYNVLRDFLPIDNERTAIHMEALWDHFKPPLLQQASMLPCILQLQSLADRFDRLSGKGMISPSLVVKLWKGFRQASQLMQDGKSLVPEILIEGLTEQLENVEQTTSATQSRRAVFSAELNEISQLSYLHQVAGASIPAEATDLLNVISALRSMPTRYFLSPAQFDSATEACRLLYYLSLYTSCADEELEKGVIQPASTIQNINLSKTVSLEHLECFTEELMVFGEVLSRCATFCLQDKQQIFDAALANLSVEVQRALSCEISQSREYLRSAKTLLDEVNGYISNGSETTAAQAWTALGVAAVLLYVPNHIIDPLEKQRLQVMAQACITDQYKSRISVLEEFEHHAMLTRNPYRKQLLDKQLSKQQQKSVPSNLLPVRPKAENLPELQAEFDRVTRVVGTLCNRMISHESIEDNTLAPSLLRIIQRLRKEFAAHDDLAHPLVGFLSIILVGIMIQRNKRNEVHAPRETWLSALFAPSFSQGRLQLCFPGSAMHHLEVHVLIRATEMGLKSQSKLGTEDIFEMLYLEWKDEISKAQIENAKNSSLYTFQDQQAEIEDDEEQINLLFPGFESTEMESRVKPDGLRDLSVRLSSIHRDLHSSLDLHEVFMRIIKSTSAFDSDWNSKQILPLLYFRIHARLMELRSSSVEKSYNVYHDSNLQEAKKMAGLASDSSKRFHYLHIKWPEHDSINEVLRICADIVRQNHSEPLMKYLPRCESLHFALDQWQKVASKEFRVDDLVERLTSLIVDWRRLELSTWSRLLDYEAAECSDNAKSWWFILYENVMHVPDGQSNLRTRHQIVLESSVHYEPWNNFSRPPMSGSLQQGLTCSACLLWMWDQESRTTPGSALCLRVLAI